MEKTKRALEVQRDSFNAIFGVVEKMVVEGKFDLFEVQSKVRLLEDKMSTINELNQALLDMMLSSDDSIDSIRAVITIADKLTADFYKLKFKVEQQSCNSSSNSESKPKLKLPKIELKKFSGDLSDWLAFWSQFSRINEDSELEEEDKFQYLLQATIPNSRARQLVESYPPTSDNYPKVIESLKQRFGRQDLLIEVYVRELLKLVLDNSINKNKLSAFYDKLESQLRSLETLGVTSDTCAAMLYPLVESCLGEDLIRVWQRSTTYAEGSSLKDRLKNLMIFLQKEVENEERINLAVSGFDIRKSGKVLHHTTKKSLNMPIPTASDLLNRHAMKCVFCKKEHSSITCNEAQKWPLEERKKKLSENACCHSCLKFDHISRRCRSKVLCTHCKGRHVVIVCPRLNSKEANSTQDGPIEEQNLSNHTYTEVFLQTIAVELKGEQRTRQE